MAGVLKEDWRLCADWLVRCQLLGADHKVTSPTAQVFDLAQVLRDGVLICHLLNRLYPGAIDNKEFSQRPQMSQFLCVKNIRMFLTTCKRQFNMKTADLFENYDLFDVRDFGKVINTLSKLSNTPLAQESKIKGFTTSDAVARRNSDYRSLEGIAASVHEDEDMYGLYGQDDDDDSKIYEDLCSLRGPPKVQSKQRLLPSIENGINEKDVGDCDELYDIVGHEEEDEDIYDDLMTVRSRFSVIAGLPEPKCKRDYCIKELVETEKNYVEALNMIVKHFIRPLKETLTPQQHQTIFMHIEELFKIHTGFQSDLSRACNPNVSSKTTIASCFIKWKEKLLIYGEFCSNLPDAQDLVDEVCKKDPAVEQAITECQMKANEGKFRLRDLLSVPMQRILKYHLLLKELIRQTDSSNPERVNLDQALVEMEDLSLYINEVKRDNEALQLITEIQNSIFDLQMPRDTELKDYGRLLKDGELKVRPHEDAKSKNTKLRYLFLFDKVMMICRTRTADRFFWGESYSYRSALVLSMFNVEDCQKSKDKLYQFMLVKKDKSEVFSFYAKTEDLKRKWIDAINLALSNTSPEGARDANHDFVMHSFDKPTVCDYCKKLLRGVFYQGYQCTITKMKVHKECIIKTKSMTGPRLPQRQQMGGVQLPPPRRIPGSIPQSRPAIGKGKAAYSYQGMPKPDDGRVILKFDVGDVIDLLNTEDPNWWEGRMRGEEGFFPANYVNPHREIRRKASYLESSTPLVPPHTPGIRRPLSTVYVDLTNYPWFLDKMPRQTASKKLEQCMSGTYLVREGNPDGTTRYAISIKYQTTVKHIRIQHSAENQFYIADCRMFRSLPELVQYYQENSLEISFPGLCTTLQTPYKEAVEKLKATGKAGHEILGYCTAMYDYSANQPSQLSLKEGDRVAIISKAGGDRGWWRGQIDNKNGFFPKSYVLEDGEPEPF